MNVRRLTENAIVEMNKERGKDQPCPEVTVQILSIDFENPIGKSANAQYYQAEISDGFSFTSAVMTTLHESLISKISNNKQLKPIILVKKWLTKFSADKALIVVADIELLKNDISTKIGQPMHFDEYQANSYTNPQGSSEIPMPSISKQMKIVPKISMRIEEPNQASTQKPVPQMQMMQQSQTKSQVTIKGHTQQVKAIQQIQPRPNEMVTTPISALYPMMTDFNIKARVTLKTDRRQFSNKSNGRPGEFFRIDIVDQNGTTIDCAFFNNACEKFYDCIEVGKVYIFSKGQVKQNRYSTGNKYPIHRYQITFEDYSIIKEADDDENIKGGTFEFVKVSQISLKNNGEIIDLLGVVRDSSQVQTIQLKTGESKARRNYTVFDQTGPIEVTFWGQLAENTNLKKGDIVALKQLKITEFMENKNLNAQSGTTIEANPQNLSSFEEYANLCKWYQENENNIQFSKTAPEPTTHQLKSLKFVDQEAQTNQHDEKYKNFCEVRANLVVINTSNKVVYPSCTKCPKKMQNNESGNFTCTSCNITVPKPNWKYILTAKIIDATGALWVTFHDQLAQYILCIDYTFQFFQKEQKSADQYNEITEEARSDLIKCSYFNEYRFLILTKIEEYNGTVRPRHQVLKIIENQYASETSDLLNEFYKLMPQYQDL